MTPYELKLKRETLGITIEQLAKHCRVHPRTAARWEAEGITNDKPIKYIQTLWEETAYNLVELVKQGHREIPEVDQDEQRRMLGLLALTLEMYATPPVFKENTPQPA